MTDPSNATSWTADQPRCTGIRKHFGELDLLGDGAEVGLAAGAAPLEVVDARPVDATWLLDGLWRQLHVDAAVRAACGLVK